MYVFVIIVNVSKIFRFIYILFRFFMNLLNSVGLDFRYKIYVFLYIDILLYLFDYFWYFVFSFLVFFECSEFFCLLLNCNS